MAKIGVRLPLDPAREARFELSRGIRARMLEIPVESSANLLPGAIDIRLAELQSYDGNTTLLEQVIIIGLAKSVDARKVFELGTFDGRTSANLAANLPTDAEVLTIDLPAAAANAAKFKISKHDMTMVLKERSGTRLAASTRVTQLLGDTATFDFSPWSGTCDLVFIDAGHEYDYVKNDSEVAMRLLKAGGVCLWHDYGAWIGVTKALNDLYLMDGRFRTIRHVEGTTICYMRKQSVP